MRGQRALSASRDEEASLGAGANSRKAAVAPVRHGEKLRLAQYVVLSSIEFLEVTGRSECRIRSRRRAGPGLFH